MLSIKLPVIVEILVGKLRIQMHSMTHLSIFSYSFYWAKKKTLKETQSCLILDVISVGYPSIPSDEHVSWVLVWVSFDVLNELDDCFTHQVRFIDLELVTDGGHVFLEG